MPIQYEIKDNKIEIHGPTTTTDPNTGETINIPRKVNFAIVKRLYDENGNVEMESAPHRPGLIREDDLEKEFTVNPDGKKEKGRDLLDKAAAIAGDILKTRNPNT